MLPEHGGGLRVSRCSLPRLRRGQEPDRAERGQRADLPQLHARDFQNPELRPYLDKYLRGTDGFDAVERVKLMKLLWDAVGTEFGGRARALRDQLRRQPRGDPRYALSARTPPGRPTVEGVRRPVPVRVRPQRLDGAGPDQHRQDQPVRSIQGESAMTHRIDQRRRRVLKRGAALATAAPPPSLGFRRSRSDAQAQDRLRVPGDRPARRRSARRTSS